MRCFIRFVAVCVAAVSIPAVAEAQSVDEIVAKNLQAKGGIDLIRQTTSVKMTGMFTTYSPQGQSMDMRMTTWAKRPNLMRREAVYTPPLAAGQAIGPSAPRRMVQASDGTSVWMQVGTGAPQALSKAEADPMMKDAEFDSVFVDYANRGITIQLVGRETLNGRPVYHLKVSRSRSPDQHYYLDQETGLEAKVTTEVTQGASTAKVETEISDFRKVEGRMVPFKTRQLVNGQPAAEMTIDTVQFNLPMPDSLFALPAGK